MLLTPCHIKLKLLVYGVTISVIAVVVVIRLQTVSMISDLIAINRKQTHIPKRFSIMTLKINLVFFFF